MILPEITHHHIEVLLGNIAGFHHFLLSLITHKEYVKTCRITGYLGQFLSLPEKLCNDIYLPVGKIDERS